MPRTLGPRPPVGQHARHSVILRHIAEAGRRADEEPAICGEEYIHPVGSDGAVAIVEYIGKRWKQRHRGIAHADDPSTPPDYLFNRRQVILSFGVEYAG